MSNYRKLPSERETKKALSWLIPILEHEKMPFQIVGGLAAKAYGANRALVDIDLYTPNKYLKVLATKMQGHLEHPPISHKSENWDLIYMSLYFGNQKIEIGDGDNTKIYNANERKWETQKIDYRSSEILNLFGFRLPVMPKEQLITT